MKSERVEAILAGVRGPNILNIGCVNHSIPLTEAEKERWLHYRLCERFPHASVLGLDIDRENVARMQRMGIKAEVGEILGLAWKVAEEHSSREDSWLFRLRIYFRPCCRSCT